MARKVINRKELRAEAEAAEALERDEAETDDELDEEDGEEGEEEGEEEEEVKPKKKAAKRKTKAKTVESERKKLCWGIFNQSGKRIALYDFTQKKQAEAKAAELSANGKSQHFVQKVKEPISE